MLRQIRIHHKAVIRIGSDDEFPPSHRQQIILLHQTPHFLGAHVIAFPLHQHGHAAVSVKAVRYRDPLDHIPQGHLGFRRRFLLPVPIETGPAHGRQLAHPHDA